MTNKPKTKGFAMNISENTTETNQDSHHENLRATNEYKTPHNLPTFRTASGDTRSEEIVLTDPLVGKSTIDNE